MYDKVLVLCEVMVRYWYCANTLFFRTLSPTLHLKRKTLWSPKSAKFASGARKDSLPTHLPLISLHAPIVNVAVPPHLRQQDYMNKRKRIQEQHEHKFHTTRNNNTQQ